MSTDKPTPLPVRFLNVPHNIRELPLFNHWRYENHNGRWSKIPKRCFVNPQADWAANAKTTNPEQWIDFQQAWDAWKGYQGTESAALRDGLALRLGCGLLGIDIDKCRINGILHPFARRLIHSIPSYWELSPSGTGIHCLTFASLRGIIMEAGHEKLPLRKQIEESSKLSIEIYDESSPRYFTLTGHQIPLTSSRVKDCQAAFETVYHDIFADELRAIREKPKSNPGRTYWVDDLAVLDHIRVSRSAAKFELLRTELVPSGYHSASEADQAFCNLLVFWCGDNEEQINRFFENSVRNERWDKEQYRNKTLASALSYVETRFDWNTIPDESTINRILGWEEE